MLSVLRHYRRFIVASQPLRMRARKFAIDYHVGLLIIGGGSAIAVYVRDDIEKGSRVYAKENNSLGLFSEKSRIYTHWYDELTPTTADIHLKRVDDHYLVVVPLRAYTTAKFPKETNGVIYIHRGAIIKKEYDDGKRTYWRVDKASMWNPDGYKREYVCVLRKKDLPSWYE